MHDHRPIDVMIAGAQKAGTTTLAEAIERHPDVVTHESVEFAYFVNPDRFPGGYPQAFEHDFVQPVPAGVLLAKSAGVMYLAHARERLAELCPDCHVVVILRDPVERAWSAYWYQRRTGTEDAPTFEAAIEREPDRLASDPGRFHQHAYLDRGDYLPQIEALEQLFGERLTVLLMDDLVADQRGAVGRVAEAIGLDPAGLPEEVANVAAHGAADARSPRVAKALRKPGPALRAAGRIVPAGLRERVKFGLIYANERALDVEPMQATTRARLVEHFAPRNERLAAHLGRSLDGWSS